MVLVFAGTQGKGILGSLVLSVVNRIEALTIWSNFSGSGDGYFEYLFSSILTLPTFTYSIGYGLDFLLYYVFLAWHSFYPVYIAFIALYYNYWGILFSLIAS